MAVAADNLFAPSFNITTHGKALWDVLYRSGANAWTDAQADAVATMKPGLLGLAVEITDTNNLLVLSQCSGFRVKLPSTNGLSGTYGDPIWLSTSVAAAMTLTKPTSGYVLYLGRWFTTTEIIWDPWPFFFEAGTEPEV